MWAGKGGFLKMKRIQQSQNVISDAEGRNEVTEQWLDVLQTKNELAEKESEYTIQ